MNQSQTLALTAEQAALLKLILVAEWGDKIVEARRAKNLDYKDDLQATEKLIQEMLGQLDR